MPEQVPFANADFVVNAEPRCPCILLLDVSGSMQGEPIRELNAGLEQFKDELMSDSLTVKRVEVGIVTFGSSVEVQTEFCTADNFAPPKLSASGQTPMGEAIMKALDILEERKRVYRENGISLFRPWVFLITDGGPTDAWKEAATRVREGEARRSFSFFCVGVENANEDILKQISVKEPLKLKGVQFRKLFEWLSSSLKSVSRSKPGDAVPLSNPATPDGWASV